MRFFCWALILCAVCSCGDGISELTLTGACDGYSDPTKSSYVVPWETGNTHKINQGNCGPASHYGASKYAYDVEMDIGTKVVAMRAGTVIEVVEDKQDGNGCSGGENHIYIKHSDGTTAQYLHLTYNGALVNNAATITKGQVIGYSGNSGCSAGPHLHVQVNETSETGASSIPINFSNVDSNKRGLQTGKSYLAK